MSAADYYGSGGHGHASSHSPSPYHPQPQYAPSPSPSHSPYPQQPTYAQPPPQSQNHLSPYPSQPQYARPGSAHSDAGFAPPPHRDPRHGSASASPLPRPHSADPYASGYNNRDPSHRAHGGEQDDGERGLGATLIGGGAGGLLGHKLGKGKLGTLFGSAVGAVAANVIENKLEGKHGKHGKHGGHQNPYGQGHGHHGGGGGGGLLGSAGSFFGGGSSHHGSSHHGGHHGHHGGW